MGKLNILGIALFVFILIPFPFIFTWYDDYRATDLQNNNIIEIEGWIPEDGGWIPSHIELKAHQTYTFRVMANDVSHGFLVNEFDISLFMIPGHPIEFKYKPEKTGTFIFSCSIWCAEDHSEMIGEIVVT
jgi:heme/copper-type cytochrome/quinol oxidase subunit 2